jgi:diketogulonate reductase-like aldo/keto reductase
MPRCLKKIPMMGLGTFIGIELDRIEDFDKRMALVEKTVYNALRIGYRHIDLAENYGNLLAVGQALSQAMLPIDSGGLGINRSDLWVTMKSDHYTLEVVESYINILNVGYLDTFMLHHVEPVFRCEAQVKSIWEKITDLPEVLVKTFGVSNAFEGHLIRLISICEKYNLPKPFSNQIESNFWCSNDSIIRYCQAQDIQVIAYSPLGYDVASFIFDSENIREVARSIDATPAQIALAWNMSRGVSVIPKTTHIERLEENFNATQYVFSMERERDEVLSKIKPQNGDGTLTNEASKKHAEALTWQVIQTPIVMALLKEQTRLSNKVASMNLLSEFLMRTAYQAKVEAVHHEVQALGELTDEKIINAIRKRKPDNRLYDALNTHSSYFFKASIVSTDDVGVGFSCSDQSRALLNIEAEILKKEQQDDLMARC